MRNFEKIGSVDTAPLLHAIIRQKILWNQNKLRTTHEQSPHTEVDDIWLRFNDLSKAESAADIMDQHESICYPAWYALPQVHDIIFNLMRYVQGVRLGRVIITRLAPGKKIDPHIDSGDHAAYYDRYHFMIQNFPGSIFRAGNEEVLMKAGDIWWFDNQEEHEVKNNSSQDRLTMIVDIKTL